VCWWSPWKNFCYHKLQSSWHEESLSPVHESSWCVLLGLVDEFYNNVAGPNPCLQLLSNGVVP
jgi:hypothetical protein